MELAKPSLEYRKSFIEAVNEGFSFSSLRDFTEEEKQKINNDFESFFKEKYDRVFAPAKIICEDGNSYDKVPDTTYWLVDEGEFIGQFSLRHYLNDFLFMHGGNIGYVIRPSKRKMGYATKGLGLVLTEARKLGLDKVMISAKEENIGSWKAIEKNGGELDNVTAMPWDTSGPRFKRYWINLIN
ncbi:MAG: GNAT family N-acetyltransferase [Lactobacillaceae bacterium]|jgi:predicted acetyltransferase|nr:GNAT family N-acetyltransferase [Lactobacillaceae bacterium]